MADSTVTIEGNLTRDPELRYTPAGKAVVSMGVAVNKRWQNATTKEWEEQTSFFNVNAWAKLAENAAETLTKGARVIVTGTLEQRSWETPDGEKRSVVEIRADDIGPSLRFATAVVTRQGGTGGGGRPPSAAEQAAQGDDDLELDL